MVAHRAPSTDWDVAVAGEATAFTPTGNRIDGHPVFVELGDGQSQRIDRLELWEYSSLVAYLLGVQVVGDTQQPMLRPRFPRVAL